MTTSVVSKLPTQLRNHPAVLAVFAARRQRLPQLLAAVDAGALCGPNAPDRIAPDSWFRGEEEKRATWNRRVGKLQSVCAACPVRAACEESALRQGEGSIRKIADMVRGGRTGRELYHAGLAQEQRLTAARAEDERAAVEERELRRLAIELRQLTLVHRDSRSDSRVSDDIRAKTAELRTVLAARRARTGQNSIAAVA